MRGETPAKDQAAGSSEPFLSPEQARAMAELLRDPQDAQRVIKMAEAWSTEDVYQAALSKLYAGLAARDACEIHEHERAANNDPIVMVTVAYTALNQILLAQRDRLTPELAAGQQGELYGLEEYTGSKIAARALLASSVLRNLPLDSADRITGLLEQRLSRSNLLIKLWRHSFMELKSLQHTLQQIPGNPRQEARFTEALSQENDGLFQAVRQLQKYGIKSAYVADHTPLPIADWHVFDRRDLADGQIDSNERAFGDTHALAVFRSFGLPLSNEPREVKMTGDAQVGDATIESRYIMLEGEPELAKQGVEFILGKDGHLSTLKEVSFAWFTDELGLGWEYEALRAQVLSIYADMVLPSYIVDNSKEIEAAGRQMSQKKRARSSDFMNLLLARQRVIKQHPDLADLIRRENTRQSGMVRRHGVVGFIRRLPKGQRASRQQRELCLREQGILLPLTGETYVREHLRGGEKPADGLLPDTHRARIRHPGGSIVSQPVSPSELLAPPTDKD